MNAFLLVFDLSQATRQSVTMKIDKISAVEDWYAFLGNSICIISKSDARKLAKLVREGFPDLRFIVVEIDQDNRGGWLPKSVWDFIREAHSAKSSAA